MDKVLGTRPTTGPLNLVDTGELYTEIERDQGIKKVFNKIRERGRGKRREGGGREIFLTCMSTPLHCQDAPFVQQCIVGSTQRTHTYQFPA